MIHSSAIDNWQRIKILHSIANDFYEITKKSKYRNRKNDISEGFYFEVDTALTMQKESCIVEMIMAWCVITLESQINHAIAETESEEQAIINAIEHPGRSEYSKKRRSALATKLLILSKGNSVAALIKLADEISDLRNEIIHDKPFELMDRGEGNIEVIHFRERGNSDGKRYKYEDLHSYYGKCQKICDFIDSHYIYSSPLGERIHFNF